MGHDAGAWGAVAGTTYEFELDWDIIAGQTRLYIDGSQLGPTALQTGVHDDDDIGLFRVGNTYGGTLESLFLIDYVMLFNEVQNTGSSYTPVPPPSSTIYTDSSIQPDIPFIYDTRLNFFEVFSNLNGNNITYQISADNGSTFQWFNSTWVDITPGQSDSFYYYNESNTADAINNNIIVQYQWVFFI